MGTPKGFTGVKGLAISTPYLTYYKSYHRVRSLRAVFITDNTSRLETLVTLKATYPKSVKNNPRISRVL